MYQYPLYVSVSLICISIPYMYQYPLYVLVSLICISISYMYPYLLYVSLCNGNFLFSVYNRYDVYRYVYR